MEIKDFDINKDNTLEYQFINLQRQIKPDFLIEAGAFEATFSNTLSKELGIPAVAFEASKYAYNYFKNTSYKNVNYLNLAISDKEELLHIYLDSRTEKNPQQNSSILKKFKKDNKYLVPHKIMATSLDRYFEKSQNNFSRASLWIDVEGANDKVLSGARKTLSKCISIFIETENDTVWQNHYVNWNTEKVYKFLDTHGFQLVSSESVYENQSNCIFIRKDHLENYKTS